VSFEWADFYTLAAQLHANPPDGLQEAVFRTVIGRAYYAAFCAARDFAHHSDNLAITRGGPDHELVKRHFRDDRDDTRHKIGVWLGRLMNNRAEADYKAEAAITKATADQSLALSKNVLDALSSLRRINDE
jgi:uncharacterized protein (UPF0332 family)